MIAYIKGLLLDKKPNTCTVFVSGIGYEVELTLKDWDSLPAQGEEITLYIQAIYREDAQLLFGFSEKQQKEAFCELNKASGVGPKMALQILDTYKVEDLSLLVAQGNHMALTRVKGIGPKLAKRLMIDLKGKLVYQSCPEKAMQSVASIDDAVNALVRLGYKEARARDMVRNAQGMTVEDIIKSALQSEGSKT